MKKVLLSLLLLLALFTNAQVGFGPADKSSYILAQPTAQSLAATGSIQWTVKPGATYLLTISNAPAATTAFAATVTFEVSADNTNWTAVNANPRIGLPGAGLAAASTTTAAGLWEIYATGFTNYIRARVSAYTSGTVWAYLDALGIDNEIIMMPFTPSVTSGANLTGWINTSGLSEIGIHVSAVTTTVVTAQGTDDPTGTVVQSIPLVNDNSANQAAATTFTAAGTYIIANPNHKWVRFQVTTTGTVLTIQGVAARFGQSVKLSNSQGGIGLNGASVTIGSGTVTTVSTVTTLSQFLASAAAADATANPTTTGVRDFLHSFNGTTWDRFYGNYNTTTGDVGAKTATFNGATQTNFNARGAIITVLCGTVTGTSPTMTVTLQWSFDGGTTWLNLGANTTALTATGTTAVMQIYPTNFSGAGATPSTLITSGTVQFQQNSVLPRTWRLAYTIGGTTPSFTITGVYVNYLL